jgi:hypothetical protein
VIKLCRAAYGLTFPVSDRGLGAREACMADEIELKLELTPDAAAAFEA